jgi:hypothetical protein
MVVLTTMWGQPIYTACSLIHAMRAAVRVWHPGRTHSRAHGSQGYVLRRLCSFRSQQQVYKRTQLVQVIHSRMRIRFGHSCSGGHGLTVGGVCRLRLFGTGLF